MLISVYNRDRNIEIATSIDTRVSTVVVSTGRHYSHQNIDQIRLILDESGAGKLMNILKSFDPENTIREEELSKDASAKPRAIML